MLLGQNGYVVGTKKDRVVVLRHVYCRAESMPLAPSVLISNKKSHLRSYFCTFVIIETCELLYIYRPNLRRMNITLK